MILLIFPAFLFWINWYQQLIFVNRDHSSSFPRLPLKLTPAVCTVILFTALRYFGAAAIRADLDMFLFYLFFGWMVVGSLQWISPFFGISMRDDVIERDNEAASYALSGAMLGVTLCFAGSNAGEGPGPADVIFCAGLSIAAFFIVWAFVVSFSDINDRITIDHDEASGHRLGATLTATGLILGRAVAGPWVSENATLQDFWHIGWPVIPLAIVAIIIDAVSRPSKTRPVPSALFWGIIPSIGYLIFALLYVVHKGAW
jgi:uncharacterized membrane protein YjfL (UPF0719 family)